MAINLGTSLDGPPPPMLPSTPPQQAGSSYADLTGGQMPGGASPVVGLAHEIKRSLLSIGRIGARIVPDRQKDLDQALMLIDGYIAALEEAVKSTGGPVSDTGPQFPGGGFSSGAVG